MSLRDVPVVVAFEDVVFAASGEFGESIAVAITIITTIAPVTHSAAMQPSFTFSRPKAAPFFRTSLNRLG
ncbi:MAG: hypothetical protein ACR2I2_03785 [Bryobacteraceae bacterium]